MRTADRGLGLAALRFALQSDQSIPQALRTILHLDSDRAEERKTTWHSETNQDRRSRRRSALCLPLDAPPGSAFQLSYQRPLWLARPQLSSYCLRLSAVPLLEVPD